MKLRYIALLVALIVVMGAGAASAKSLYVNADLNANSPIQAYDISGNTLTYQMTSVPTHYGGAGLGIDTDSETLFVTFEGYGTFDIVDAKTLAVLGTVTAPGAKNLAGIVVDQDKQQVYTNDRGAKSIYIYDWDATTSTLTLNKIQSLVGTTQIYGIALDEANDLLYVGDLTTQVKIFNTADWSSAGSFPVSQKVMGIAVDATNGYVYTGNAYPNAGSIGLLSQYDLGTSTEVTVNTRTLPGGVSLDNAVGIAVDPATGLVYVTTGNQASGGSDRILVFNPSLGTPALEPSDLTDSTGDIGNPTGICVPGKDISFNPLNMAKTDSVTQVYQGGTLTYAISYDNALNNNPVNSVMIVDSLPVEVTFVSASDSGVYNSTTHTVTWTIGTLAAGAPSDSVSVTVNVGASTPIGTMLDNAVTINSDDTAQTTQHDDDTEVILTDNEIPEFPTVALPIAAIIGLAFFFQRRKNE
ncbi:PEF-CTERM sorting domain-containing protein [Methanococcoides burtonii]|uniref:Serine-rich surface protein (Adhesin) with possible NHL repeats n=1 Tax=Methanococcoides burtonii (strain DSM 6242 / NBRC 107633 / OCM 468 / ACE-M) TaxID=259564 RepID=Q12ZP4_METBU|nr:PEF-CTERM sorting domain-containing protein [Methanococcoides burtonii]ABE51082.1 Serine-rich surface protein (adhesin) with possible NHL repeats [Methanococcoides burtonii DSM 6242]